MNEEFDIEDFTLRNNMLIEGLIELLLSKGIINQTEYIETVLTSIDRQLEDIFQKSEE